VRLLGMAPTLSPNNHTPWQLLAKRTSPPHTTRKATHRGSPHHSYIILNTKKSHITCYFIHNLPPERHEFAPQVPSRANPQNTHLTKSHGIENRGHGAHQAAPKPPGTEGSGGIPPPHHCQAYTMRRAPTTPTYPNAPTPSTTPAAKHHIIAYNNTQQHSECNIEYVSCYSKTTTTSAHPRAHVHFRK
jgi:hypothetical protein